MAKYSNGFDLFSKGDVNGPETRPLFVFLKSAASTKDIQWNFAKFLLDQKGDVFKSYGPRESPLSFESDIKKLLAAN